MAAKPKRKLGAFARRAKSKASKAPAVQINLSPSLDPNFSEPVISAGRSLAPLFGFGGRVVANHGGCVFVKEVNGQFIVCAHLRVGGWTIARANVATLDLAWKHAQALAAMPNIGPTVHEEENEFVSNDPEQHTTQQPPRVFTTRRPNAIH